MNSLLTPYFVDTLLVACFALSFGPLQALSQETVYNLGFERRDGAGQPSGWFAGGPGYSVSCDSTTAYEGKWSLHFHSSTPPSPYQFGQASRDIPGEYVRGHSIEISGYIHTQQVDSGYAGLWCRIQGRDSILAFDNMADRGARGNTPWRKYSLKLYADSSAVGMRMGVMFPGMGDAWFDGLEITIDGKPLSRYLPDLTMDDTRDLLALCKPFLLDSLSSASDIEWLNSLASSASVLGLGEATHGSRECFGYKFGVFKYLARRGMANTFVLEADVGWAMTINEYIHGAPGDPSALLSKLGYWTWNTAEFRDFISWLHNYNLKHERKLSFLGADMQSGDGLAHVLRRLKNVHQDSLGERTSTFCDLLDSIGSYTFLSSIGRIQLSDTLQFLQDKLARYREHVQDKLDAGASYAGLSAAEILHLVGVASQVVNSLVHKVGGSDEIRDSCMAANVEWIVSHGTSSGVIVVSAHDGHVGRDKRFMGGFLAHMLGEKYKVIGMAFYEGAYNATQMFSPEPPKEWQADIGEKGSIEYLLHAAMLPSCYVPIQQIAARGAAWIRRPLDLRFYGAFNTPSMIHANLLEQFDGIIYFPRIIASSLLR